ncbi:uncharacterized protein LOC136072349 [Hydra vulgaris]|uniref:uncharacterized protein LOC136072349 n=1 Tax=Hydra vulgaris TaxID=6087 RepID=UPI0032EA5338
MKTCTPELKPIKVNGLWEFLDIDLVGLYLNIIGNKYILIVTDFLSKYVEAFSIPEKSAFFVSKCFVTLFYRFGSPKKVLSDQCREFVNSLNEFLFSIFKIRHLITSAYQLKTKGQYERTNQIIKRALLKVANESQNISDTLLEPVLFGPRTCEQSSTKFTLFFLMFGKKAQFFSYIALNDNDSDFYDDNIDIAESKATESQVQEIMDSRFAVHVLVKNNILLQKKKGKNTMKKKQFKDFKSLIFKIGDKVLVKNYKNIGPKVTVWSMIGLDQL